MGGFWADTVGIKAAIASFLPLGALLMCFGAQSVALYAVGTLLFNTSMPVTLFMAIRALPRWRNAAFGMLAALLDGGLRSGDVGARRPDISRWRSRSRAAPPYCLRKSRAR